MYNYEFTFRRPSRRQLFPKGLGQLKRQGRSGGQRAQTYKGFLFLRCPIKLWKGLKVNGKEGVTQRHNSDWGERKSNQLGDANFIEHQLRRVFYDTFLRKQKSRAVSSQLEARGRVVRCTSKTPPSLPQPQQHWVQALMGWHLLYACPRPHWGNEAVSVCCSGRLRVPFITVTSQKHTERGGSRGAPLSNLSCFGLYDHGPHVASTPPRTHTSSFLPFGHRWPLYRLTPAAKICVCTANRGLGKAPN